MRSLIIATRLSRAVPARSAKVVFSLASFLSWSASCFCSSRARRSWTLSRSVASLAVAATSRARAAAPLPDGRASQPAEEQRQQPEGVRGGQRRLAPRPLRHPLDGPGRAARSPARRPRTAAGRPRAPRPWGNDRPGSSPGTSGRSSPGRGEAGVPLRRRFRRTAPHGVERLDHAVAAEGGLAGQQGVEDRAQAVDIGRRVIAPRRPAACSGLM